MRASDLRLFGRLRPDRHVQRVETPAANHLFLQASGPLDYWPLLSVQAHSFPPPRQSPNHQPPTVNRHFMQLDARLRAHRVTLGSLAAPFASKASPAVRERGCGQLGPDRDGRHWPYVATNNRQLPLKLQPYAACRLSPVATQVTTLRCQLQLKFNNLTFLAA